ncbi:MAG: GMC family oxidoreductase [Chitinispirillaceae bacterium]|nr:GMC family oxidoreductase [Chitinispirillaceae bacterium]
MPRESHLFDVCVVGSGAGGAPAAHALAKRGLDVVLVDRGPDYDRRALNKDELSVCRMPLFRPGNEKGMREIWYGDGPPVYGDHLWPAVCVGGGTMIMSGFFFRMHKRDFRPVSHFGSVRGATHQDWPMTLDDLTPFYDEAERTIGISGSPSKTNVPLAPLKAHPVSALIDRASRNRGLHAIVTPRAVLSEERDNRGPCSYSGLCGSYPCLTGAKGNVKETYIRKALETGRLTLRPGQYIYRLETRGDRITGAFFFGTNNAAGVIRARIFILACGSIETARLLLNSHSLDHPNGLANRSGQVGKNLTFTIPCEVTGFFNKGLFPAPAEAKSPFVQRTIDNLQVLDDPRLDYQRGGMVVMLFPHPNPIQRMMTLSYEGTRRVFGSALKKKVRDYFSYLHLMSDSFIEFLPNARTFVTLAKSARDYWGIPAAGIHVVPHEENLKAVSVMAQRIIELYREMGAAGIEVNPSPFTAGELQHGTCRSGNDPKTSVLDPLCRSHEIKNLYITDGSFMPSGIPVPSTFTIMANSLRVAGHIARNG